MATAMETVDTTDSSILDICENLTTTSIDDRMLIGISGVIGSGKSTVVDFLKAEYGFSEYSFAKPLKDVAITLGFEPHQVFGTQENKLEINQFWGISGREFLQVFGSEVCRDYVPKVLPGMQFNGSTMWVRLFEKYYSNTRGHLAVSDVRFADEADKIRSMKGVICKIVRPRMVDSHVTTVHQSESSVDMVRPNIIINNNGSLQDLYLKVRQAIKWINMGMCRNTDAVIYL